MRSQRADRDVRCRWFVRSLKLALAVSAYPLRSTSLSSLACQRFSSDCASRDPRGARSKDTHTHLHTYTYNTQTRTHTAEAYILQGLGAEQEEVGACSQPLQRIGSLRPRWCSAHTHTYTHTHIHTHTYIHTHIHTYLHSYIHTFIHSYMHACTQTHIHTCMQASTNHTYIHTCIHTYKHTHMHACMHACMHTYIHTYIHTHIKVCPSLHPPTLEIAVELGTAAFEQDFDPLGSRGARGTARARRGM